jgi:hypothetical protein
MAHMLQWMLWFLKNEVSALNSRPDRPFLIQLPEGATEQESRVSKRSYVGGSYFCLNVAMLAALTSGTAGAMHIYIILLLRRND